MELNGNITPGASLEGSFDFDSGDYNNLKNKPSINGVTLEGNKTSSELHIEGGGGGTSDYEQLDNKPAINGHTLTGDQTAEDLDIITGYPVVLPTPADSSKYLDGAGNFTTPVELPTPADPSKYYDGSGNWSTPPTGSWAPTYTEIYEAPSDIGVGTYTLDEDIDNYKFLEIYYGVYNEYTGSPYISEVKLISVNTLNYLYTNGKELLLTGYTNRNTYIKLHDDVLEITNKLENTILRIVGIN